MSALHFIEIRYRKTAPFFVEREVHEMDLETTIRDIISGEVDYVARVLEVIPGEVCRDISEDVARTIFDRYSHEPFASDVADFLERHLPDSITTQLRRAA